MNTILRNTHTKQNIELLKVRDYYFNYAKRLNLIKTIIVLLPPLMVLITYILSLMNIPSLVKGYDELIVAALTTVVGFSVYFINHIIHKNTDISNHFRALYDHKVLGTKYNPHMFNKQDILNLEKPRKLKNSAKYEVWYSEVFSDNHNANVFCCQMDNLLYAKYAYKTAKMFYFILLSVLSVFVVAAIIFSLLQQELLTAILVIFSVFECYDVFVNKISDLNSALDLCTDFCKYTKDISPDSLNQELLDQVQDIIDKNRDLCIFLPRIIRNRYLKNNETNKYYSELNEYKRIFMGEGATIPDTADKIDVVYEDGSDSVPLSEMQCRLSAMLEKVVKVLDDNKIEYMLDGGTLIGAMRSSTKGFIPWDDDIDITIPIHQIEEAKRVLRQQLDFVIQDAVSEPFYSTRLSPFKIREQNSQSMISEKDSLLYEGYQNKGIFIDVYAFSPILVSKPIDILFRRLIVHPINRKLERIENHYPTNGTRDLQYKKFFRAKQRHLRILSFYQKHAKNTKWYAYFPGYVYNLKKAGPYHTAEELYKSGVSTALWEAKEYRIPANPNAILSAYYGAEWETPPFKSKEALITEHNSLWIGKAPAKVSALKHIANIISYNK